MANKSSLPKSIKRGRTKSNNQPRNSNSDLGKKSHETLPKSCSSLESIDYLDLTAPSENDHTIDQKPTEPLPPIRNSKVERMANLDLVSSQEPLSSVLFSGKKGALNGSYARRRRSSSDDDGDDSLGFKRLKNAPEQFIPDSIDEMMRREFGEFVDFDHEI